ncbi:MAG TPA: hypothetical protein VNA20_05995 [Frankiaceae bacterium]|nr:hypothetical protein [Frankiaceae bacterium]
MAKYNSRGARLTALALATGTLVVAGTGQAGAAPIPVPTVFGGEAAGAAIHLEINLPVPVAIPGVGDLTKIVQDISLVDGSTEKGVQPVTKSVATAVLGDGSIKALNDILGLRVQSSLDGQSSASDALVSQNLGIIKLGAGEITSSVLPDSATSGLTSSSTSQLLGLEIGLGALPADLPLKADLDGALDTVAETVDGTVGSVSEAVDSALAVLDEASQGATAPVVAQVEAVKQELVNLLDSLTDTVANLDANTNLVELGLLKSTEHITRAGSMVTAKATSEVVGLKVLGDLVTLDGVKTESVSSANGSKGAAAADTLTTILGLKVGEVLDLKLTSEGLEGTIAGNALPDVAKDAIQDVITAVNGVLAAAGVQIINGQTDSVVDPDGKFARSSSEGVGIVVNPLKAAAPLVKIQLVPAGTAVNAAHVPTVKPPVVKPPAVNPPPARPDAPLARTGVELPLFAVFGTGLAGLAMVARRRRTVEG